jgi:hypothetical protein
MSRVLEATLGKGTHDGGLVRVALLGLSLVVLAAPASGAELSHTVYICDESSSCTLSSSVEVPGPNPLDPGASASDTDTLVLMPGVVLEVFGVVSSSAVVAVANVTGLQAQWLPLFGPAPPSFRLGVSDGDDLGTVSALASVYWEDEVFVTGFDLLGNPLPQGTEMVFKPSIRISGDLDLFVEEFGGGGVEWRFGMSVNDDTFWTEGGDCIEFSVPGPVACGPTSGFGSFVPLRDLTVRSGIPFTMKGGLVTTLFGDGIRGSADLASTVEWLGIELFDLGGSPVAGFSVSSTSGIDWSLASVPDRDADGVPDSEDICPDTSDPDQIDVDENGIGNLCECGDQTGDGTVDVTDILAINAAIFQPALATDLCDTNDDQLCDVQDILGANAKIFGAEAYCSRYPTP